MKTGRYILRKLDIVSLIDEIRELPGVLVIDSSKNMVLVNGSKDVLQNFAQEKQCQLFDEKLVALPDPIVRPKKRPKSR